MNRRRLLMVGVLAPFAAAFAAPGTAGKVSSRKGDMMVDLASGAITVRDSNGYERLHVGSIDSRMALNGGAFARPAIG